MSVKELSKYTFVAKYAKYLPEKKRRETWVETVTRVKEMHLGRYPQIASEIEWAFDRVYDKLVLPAMRTLQYGGAPILKNHCRNYNCAATYCDRVRFFQEMVFVLLSGTGAGFSVQKHHVDKLPDIHPRAKKVKEFVVPDTIEGWADSFGVLISSYVDEKFATFPEYSGYKVRFNFSQLRPKGSRISSGGKSPGPDPLRNALEKCEQVIERRLKDSNRLRPIDAHDIVMHSSDCVISGGIRRSATISLFSLDDEEMMTCKTGNWFYENPQRGRANNSAMILRDKITEAEFSSIMKNTREFGEPGFLFCDDLETLVNPCLPRDTQILVNGGYRAIGDLYAEGKPTQVWSDDRIGKGDELHIDRWGKTLYDASPVVLTQKNAKIYEIWVNNCWSIKATANHQFPTPNGRKRLDELTCDDYLFIHEENLPQRITEISYWGEDDVFCLNQPTTNAIIANGIVTGNCVEIGLRGYDSYGNSGWQFCNLTISNGKKIKSKDTFKEASRAAAIIGTCQAGYADFPYLGSVTESIVRREALLGCSITGIMENPDIILDAEVQREMAEHILEVNYSLASQIGIEPCARATCEKPEGSSSAVLGTSSGIHPHHAKRYFRRVQANKTEPTMNFFSKYNPQACEESVWSANKTDAVITFCVEVDKGSRFKNDMSAIDLLEQVKLTQQNWVESGTRHTHCVEPWLRHSVSNTISVRPEEWDAVSKYLYENRQYFAGVSLLSATGDKDYPQAPFCTVYTAQAILKHYGDGALLCSGLIEKCVRLFDGNLWRACDFINGVIQDEREECQELLTRATNFSFRYFGGDIKKMTYALKDVYNLKLWNDLNRDYQEVDYTKMIEDTDNTTFSQESACAGGKCEII